MGGAYYQQGNSEKALAVVLEAAKYHRKNQNKLSLFNIESNLGLMYFEMKQYDKAIIFLKGVLKLGKEIDPSPNLNTLLNSLGAVYKAKREYKLALDYFNQSLVIVRNNGNKHDIAERLCNIGGVLVEMKDYETAYETLSESIEIAKEINSFNTIVHSYMSISFIFSVKGDFINEEKYLMDCLELSISHDLNTITQKCYFSLSKMYKTKDRDIKKSLEYIEKYINLKDELTTKDFSSKIAEMQTKYETEAKEKEAEIYKLKSVELSKKNKTIQNQKEKLEQTLTDLEKSEINYNYVSKELKRSFGSVIIYKSPQMKKLLGIINKVAKADSTTVLITGESGTGKELIARAIHDFSKRKSNPFCAVNISAVPESLFESEFFGYKKNAFTGALKDKIGWFEVADKGSLFLDEIGTFPLVIQTKLLGVLEERKITKLGSHDERKVDLRIICATNDDIFKMVDNKMFREDLYHRLSSFVIKIPPLRERLEDIYPLLEHFVAKFGENQKKKILKIDKNIEIALKEYPFPGNIRELKNLVERAIIMCNSSTLKLEHFSIPETTSNFKKEKRDSQFSTLYSNEIIPLDKHEKDMILKALIKTKFHQSNAAKLLDITPKAIERRMIKFGIKRK